MTLDQLRYALELLKHKNFSRAAEACHITQPSLSIQIAKLEEELNLSLFDRTRSPVEVTDYGRAVLEQARVVVDEASRLQQIASELKGQVQGVFRLGLIPTLAPSLLPLFVGNFTERYPNVRLTVVEETTERLIRQIHDGTLDTAILSTPSKCPEGLLERVLFYEPFVVLASTRHPVLEASKITPERISAHDILLLDEAHCLRDQVLQLCKSRAKANEPRLQLRSGSLQTLIELLRRQPGYTLLPILSLSALTASERQKNVRAFGKPVPSRKISLVYHKAHLKRSLIEALRDELLASLPENVFQVSSGELRVLFPDIEHFEL